MKFFVLICFLFLFACTGKGLIENKHLETKAPINDTIINRTDSSVSITYNASNNELPRLVSTRTKLLSPAFFAGQLRYDSIKVNYMNHNGADDEVPLQQFRFEDTLNIAIYLPTQGGLFYTGNVKSVNNDTITISKGNRMAIPGYSSLVSYYKIDYKILVDVQSVMKVYFSWD